MDLYDTIIEARKNAKTAGLFVGSARTSLILEKECITIIDPVEVPPALEKEKRHLKVYSLAMRELEKQEFTMDIHRQQKVVTALISKWEQVKQQREALAHLSRKTHSEPLVGYETPLGGTYRLNKFVKILKEVEKAYRGVLIEYNSLHFYTKITAQNKPGFSITLRECNGFIGG